MPISKSKPVFSLIKSLSKSEKRNFTVYSSRLQDTDGLMYIRLFEILDKQETLFEKEVREKLGNISTAKYSNLKRHLYTQILTSLRHLHKEKKADIKIREYIDFAYILYGKGEYMSALKLLDKAKKIAEKNHTDFSSIIIVEFEKLIQSRHITRSSTDTITQLIDQAQDISITIRNRAKLSNLKASIHRYYISKGHVTNQHEELELQQFLHTELEDIKTINLGMMEKVYLNQIYVWYYYILNDFRKVYKYASQWVKLFEDSEELLKRDVDLYLRGYHYILTATFNLRDKDQHKSSLLKFEEFRRTQYKSFNDNSKITSFLYVHTGRMNQHFLSRTFNKGVEEIPRTLRRLKRYQYNLDAHKFMIIYYKIAWMYMANNQPNIAKPYLENIIDNQSQSLRIDIQIYSRLMYLMLYYDLDDFESLRRLSNIYLKYICKANENNEVQLVILNMFKQLSSIPILERKDILKENLKTLKKQSRTKYNSRAFLYLDIINWIESKN